jgi:hypothetical protein
MSEHSTRCNPPGEGLHGLSAHAINHIDRYILKPLLAEAKYKDFYPIVEACSGRIKVKEIVCLRDLEKLLLILAPVSNL